MSRTVSAPSRVPIIDKSCSTTRVCFGFPALGARGVRRKKRRQLTQP